jgi:AraC-like DNA-binding protein
MQPKLEKVIPNLSSSFFVKREIVPYMDYPWHYHPEFEIIFVEKSYGLRFMGNHVGHFRDGDLMFISPNLPHVWRNDEDFYKGNKDHMVDVYVIQFREDALREGFFDLPEFAHFKKLFLHGQQGILIHGKEKKKISELIKNVYNSSGVDRVLLFIKTLDAFAKAKEYSLLASQGYTTSINISDKERIEKVMSFLMENYRKEFNLQEIADLVNLSKSSFCRYFRNRTHKTCSQFINEIRVAHACKFLINRNMTITEICYLTGYNNISHFNRQFKLITGLTASDYENKYLKNAALVNPY